MTFTVFEAPDVYERAGAHDFYAAHRVWLGHVPGTDWAHDALATEFASVPREIAIEQRSISAGFGAEFVAVVLILLGSAAVEFSRAFGKRTGEESADAVVAWMRERAHERRKEAGQEGADPPPDFGRYDAQELAAAMRSELADLIGHAKESLVLVGAERTKTAVLVAVYRDSEDRAEWEITVGRDSATFKRRSEEAG